METDLERWKEAVREVEDLVDVMRNLGPRVAESSEATGGGEEPKKKATSWQFQARSIIRTFMGRTKDSFGDEPEWERLNDSIQDLKTK